MSDDFKAHDLMVTEALLRFNDPRTKSTEDRTDGQPTRASSIGLSLAVGRRMASNWILRLSALSILLIGARSSAMPVDWIAESLAELLGNLTCASLLESRAEPPSESAAGQSQIKLITQVSASSASRFLEAIANARGLPAIVDRRDLTNLIREGDRIASFDGQLIRYRGKGDIVALSSDLLALLVQAEIISPDQANSP